MTNIQGAGATMVVHSLIPEIVKLARNNVLIYLSDRPAPVIEALKCDKIHLQHYKRKLPNAVSRMIECIFSKYIFREKGPLLTLGDIPLRTQEHQTLLLHSQHYITKSIKDIFVSPKLFLAKLIFKLNLNFADTIIVQSTIVKENFLATHPEFKGKVIVIAQPAPQWILNQVLESNNNAHDCGKLTLFYPATPYPHKNHKILKEIDNIEINNTTLRIILTIPSEINPAPKSEILECIGTLNKDGILLYYQQSDALLFLSKAETLGLPLIEAMWMNLYIICPDLPYARSLCDDQAIYFDPNDFISLSNAISRVAEMRKNGIRPDWGRQLQRLPSNWEVVAQAILENIKENKNS